MDAFAQSRMNIFLQVRGFKLPIQTNKKFAQLRRKFFGTDQDEYIPPADAWRLFDQTESMFSDVNMSLDVVFNDQMQKDVLFISIRNKSSITIGKLNISELMDFGTEQMHTILLINRAAVQPKIISDLSLLYARPRKDCFIGELLYWHEILIPKIKCNKVPRYTILTKTEVIEQEQKHAAQKTKFLPFAPSDPIVRYLGFRIGDVICAEDTREYRLVG